MVRNCSLPPSFRPSGPVASGDGVMRGPPLGLADRVVHQPFAGRPFPCRNATREHQHVATDPPDILAIVLGTFAGTMASRIEALIGANGISSHGSTVEWSRVSDSNR